MKYRAVIFDLDGTLLNTLRDLAESMNLVLSRLGFPEHPEEAYKYFVGDGMVNLTRRALPPEQRREDFINQVAASMREEYSRRWSRHTIPYPGILETLGKIDRLAVKLGVLSNKPDHLVKLIMAAYFPLVSFDAVQGAHPHIPLKPDPAGARLVAQRLAVAPASIIFVGDSGIDMETARAAGMHAAGVLWGFRTDTELTRAGARTLLQEPADLLILLK